MRNPFHWKTKKAHSRPYRHCINRTGHAAPSFNYHALSFADISRANMIYANYGIRPNGRHAGRCNISSVTNHGIVTLFSINLLFGFRHYIIYHFGYRCNTTVQLPAPQNKTVIVFLLCQNQLRSFRSAFWAHSQY